MASATLREPRKSLERREVAAGYGWNAGFSLISKLVFPILQIFFYRKLGPVEIGIYAVLIPIYMICESLRDAGLALTYVADPHGDEREGQYASLAMLNATIFALAVLAARSLIASFLHLPQLIWGLEMVALAIFLTGLGTIPASKLQKNARFRDAGLVDLFSNLFSYIAAFGLVLLGFRFEALVWQFVLYCSLFVLGCWLIEPVRMVWVKIEVVRAVWKHASHNLLNNLLFTVYTVADNLAVARLFGAGANGNYNAAYTFGMKPVDLFTSPLAKTLLIAYTRKGNDKQALTNVFARTIALAILVMVPLFALAACFASPLSAWILTKKYGLAGPMLSILVFYCGFRSVGLLCGNVLVSMNKPVYNVYGWLVGYATFGIAVAAGWGHIGLESFVWAITYGGCAAYIFTAICAFVQLPPRGEAARKLWRALGLSSVSVLLALGFAHSGLSAAVAFALAVVSVGAVQVLGTSLVYVGNARALFSKSGWKQIYKAI